MIEYFKTLVFIFQVKYIRDEEKKSIKIKHFLWNLFQVTQWIQDLKGKTRLKDFSV